MSRFLVICGIVHPMTWKACWTSFLFTGLPSSFESMAANMREPYIGFFNAISLMVESIDGSRSSPLSLLVAEFGL
jgi:hypothetical protein